ncbi:hypothetical protein QBC40DRAFT_326104 [Triangularia verruculosa]|uniref:2EXR domain-containing protein n=1 Tax=Triangularia verruculosa TaxID=2587418 RepID=A0AAN6XHL4_9PEZI|nr:hypothetical protein QBC40DRAFT_326104 [Triangularia verruculosa]
MTSEYSSQKVAMFGHNATNQAANEVFTLFPLLPAELRVKIWRTSLQRQRIIQVVLTPIKEAKSRYDIDGSIDTPNGEEFIAEVGGFKTISKLMRVNREARHEAQLFYRVHLPCRFIKPWEIKARPDSPTRGMLHFNPEYDFLHLFHTKDNGDNPVALLTLSNFVYHLKTTYDRRHVGLLNLALDRDPAKADWRAGAVHFDASFDASKLLPNVRNALIKTLSQLQEVFFVFRTSIVKDRDQPEGDQFELLHNSPLPIWSASPSFDRIPCDPRPSVLETLKEKASFYWFGLDSTLNDWNRFLAELGIPLLGAESCCRTSYSCGLTYSVDSALTWESFVREAVAKPQHYVFDAETAQNYLRLQRKRAGESRAGWTPAFGFWLFPLPEGIEHISRFRNSYDDDQGRLQFRRPGPDLTKVWPELLVSSLY